MKNRFLSVDFLKAAGIIYLIVLHQVMWSFIWGDFGGLRYPQAERFLVFFGARSGLHVLGFQIPLLAGITFYVSVARKHLSWKDVGKRAVMLSVLGFLMNFLAWGPADMWAWDVLPFISVSMLIAFAFIQKENFCRLRRAGLMLLGVLALFYSRKFPWPAGSELYAYKIIFGDASGMHFWPLCPWFFIFCAGIMMGYGLINSNEKRFARLAGAGVFLMAVSLLRGEFFPQSTVDQIWGPALFKPDMFFVLGITGFSLTAVFGLEWLFRRYPAARRVFDRPGLLYYSYGILWIYLITTVIGYFLTEIFYFRFPRVGFLTAACGSAALIALHLFYSFWIGKTAVSHKRNKRDKA